MSRRTDWAMCSRSFLWDTGGKTRVSWAGVQGGYRRSSTGEDQTGIREAKFCAASHVGEDMAIGSRDGGRES